MRENFRWCIHGFIATILATYLKIFNIPVSNLPSRNGNVDEPDDDEKTPLHLAAENNHPAAVRMLLDKGAGKMSLNKSSIFYYVTIMPLVTVCQ